VEEVSIEVAIGTKDLDKDIIVSLINMGKPKPIPLNLQKGISSRAKKNQNNEHMDRTIF
jgi:hypothetical protein